MHGITEMSKTVCLPVRSALGDSPLGLSFLNSKMRALTYASMAKINAKKSADFIKGLFSARDLPLNDLF